MPRGTSSFRFASFAISVLTPMLLASCGAGRAPSAGAVARVEPSSSPPPPHPVDGSEAPVSHATSSGDGDALEREPSIADGGVASRASGAGGGGIAEWCVAALGEPQPKSCPSPSVEARCPEFDDVRLELRVLRAKGVELPWDDIAARYLSLLQGCATGARPFEAHFGVKVHGKPARCPGDALVLTGTGAPTNIRGCVKNVFALLALPASVVDRIELDFELLLAVDAP